MHRKQQRILVGLVVIAAVGALVYALVPKAGPADQPAKSKKDKKTSVAGKDGGGGTQAEMQKSGPDIPPVVHRRGDTVIATKTEAQKTFQRGMDLLKSNHFVEARNKLSEALLSGKLDRRSETQARSTAEQLAELTIFSRRCYKVDPYCYYGFIKFGDTLGKINQREKLRLDYRFIMRVNNIKNDRAIRAGSRIKLVRGPCHAIISKSKYTMDLYLHREGLPMVYIKRVRVGLGKNGSTPTGLWRVAQGEKMFHPVWNPAANSQYAGKGPIDYDDPRYAFGTKGLWIGLEGLDEKTRGAMSYGIHSTNDPDSIGRADSEGCIRLKDKDIDLVYALLYEKWSTVKIVP